MNKDLQLLVILATAFLAEEYENISDESQATMKDIISQLNEDTVAEEWTNDNLVTAFAKAIENLKEVTEAYNDLEYEEDVQ